MLLVMNAKFGIRLMNLPALLLVVWVTAMEVCREEDGVVADTKEPKKNSSCGITAWREGLAPLSPQLSRKSKLPKLITVGLGAVLVAYECN